MKQILLLAFFLSIGIVFAGEYNQIPDETGSIIKTDEGNVIGYFGGKSYSYIERTDLRRYDNGKYKGLVSREIRSQIVERAVSVQYTCYEGSFYVYEATKRANAEVFPGLDDSIPSAFKVNSEGHLEMIEDNGYPTFRGFPTYSAKKIKPGDSWKANAVRTIDPLNTGKFTKMPILVEYTYLRDEVYNGEEVFLLSAKWATRYGRGYVDPAGDASLLDAAGSNSATIYVSKETGMAVVIRDSVDELYTYADGNKIAFKGTINIFTKYQPAIDNDEVYSVIQRVTGISDEDKSRLYSGKPGGSGQGYSSAEGYDSDVPVNTSSWLGETVSTDIVNVENTLNGIRLSIPNLQFKSDSAELLPSENERLDKIAEILKSSGSSMLLIEGHTADTGNPSGEMALSKNRARVIASELVKRGISSERFVIKGRGANNPVADNSTKEGMARNRRVEITILK